MIRDSDQKRLKLWINQYFRIYDIRWDIDSIAFFCDVEPDTLEDDFNALRKDLIQKGYIPMLLFEGGEYIVYVTEKAPARYRSVKVNVILLLATICTTVFVGAINWWSYDSSMDPNDFFQVFTPNAIGHGALFFAFPLLLILGIHESGHYFMARYHGVAASLPFFIPVPLPPLGTFGAFISMREPIPDKKALLDIGVAGPIAGFCVAVPVTIAGFMLTDIFKMPVPEDAGGLVYLGTSFFYDTMAYLVPTGDYLTHPTALAGWVGFLVTFLNLLPAGQLDGGHVARAMFGDNAKYLSYGSIGVMLVLAFYFQYFGWILFIFIIVFIGISHPPPLNDITRLDAKRWLTGAVVFIILIGCFTPVPLYPAEIDHDGSFRLADDTINLGPNETGELIIIVRNVGNVEQRYTLKAELGPGFDKEGWHISFNSTKDSPSKHPTLGPSRTKNMTLYITSPTDGEPGGMAYVNISLKWKDEAGKYHYHRGKAMAIIGLVRLDIDEDVIETVPGRSDPYNLTVTYLGKGDRTLRMEAHGPAGWGVEFSQDAFFFTNVTGRTAEAYFRVLIPPDGPVVSKNITFTVVTGEGEDATWYNSSVLVRVLQVFDVTVGFERGSLQLTYGENATINITVTNTGNGMDIIDVSVVTVANLSVDPEVTEVTLAQGMSGTFGLFIEPLVNRTTDLNLLVMATSRGDPGVLAKGTIEVQVSARP